MQMNSCWTKYCCCYCSDLLPGLWSTRWPDRFTSWRLEVRYRPHSSPGHLLKVHTQHTSFFVFLILFPDALIFHSFFLASSHALPSSLLPGGEWDAKFWLCHATNPEHAGQGEEAGLPLHAGAQPSSPPSRPGTSGWTRPGAARVASADTNQASGKLLL